MRSACAIRLAAFMRSLAFKALLAQAAAREVRRRCGELPS